MFLIRWLVIAVTFLTAAHFLPGIRVESFWAALIAAIVLSIVNFFVKPVIIILTLPINILMLGLFTFVANALMILLVTVLVPGFAVDGFLRALVLALIVTAAKRLVDRFIT